MRLAVIVQRYGFEVNGGAELLCRTTCEHLVKNARVQRLKVFTTCARDHTTWANHYPPGATEIAGVQVERFSNSFERDAKWESRLLKWAVNRPRITPLEPLWFVAQGPFSPDLLRRIYSASRAREFDAYLFYTYLYTPTVFGLPIVASRSILVPTAHDEKPIHLRTFELVFRLARGFAFLTPEEQSFVTNKFKRQHVPAEVVGTGIDLPSSDLPKSERTPAKPFILYVGRVEPQKGLPELFEHFERFRKLHGDTQYTSDDGSVYFGRDLQLVLAGRAHGVDIPNNPHIVPLGFVSDDDKHALLAHCETFVLPSKYESLSLVLLEAWAHRRPVLVNAGCEATSGQLRRANGGERYSSSGEFAQSLHLLLADPMRRRRAGDSGFEYVRNFYAWPAYETRLLDLIERSTAARAH